MPEYLAPGVFVEETSFRAKSIEGVGTSVAAIIGPTRYGPLRGAPEVVTSFADFQRTFGDLEDLSFTGASKPALNHTALAAKAFFDNGGKQLYVSRVTEGVNGSDDKGDNSSAVRASRAAASGKLSFQARFPGAMGNFTLEVIWRDSENLFSSANIASPEDGETVFLSATGVTAAAKVDPGIDDGLFPIAINALVTRNGDNLEIVHGTVTNGGGAVDPADLNSALLRTALPTATTRITRVSLKNPASGALAPADSMTLSLKAPTDLSAYTGAAHWGDRLTLRGELDDSHDDGVIDTFTVLASANDGLGADITVPLAALGATPGNIVQALVQRSFDLDVWSGGTSGEVIYRFAGISTANSGDTSLASKLPMTPENRAAWLTQPVGCTLGDGADVLADLNELFEPDPINNPDPLTGPRYLIALRNGVDGEVPVSADYAGEVDDDIGSTGMAALETIEDIAIVMTPAAASLDTNAHIAVVLELQKHCRKMRYRVGIVDSEKDMTVSQVRDFRSNLSDDRLALYYPWVVSADPTNLRRDNLVLPPSGFMAGIYARTDVDRGVHKAPANTPVFGALRFNQSISKFQQELLNPNGVNCLRSFPGRGHRVWGGRTLGDDPEWKYINVRRYFLYLERSIEKGTQWAVFEPNGEALWANVRSTVEDFLFNEWSNGRLLGGSPKVAYFVRCDRSTMTQNDIDNGRLVCLVGVAPLRPAEFVVFRIGQKTADA